MCISGWLNRWPENQRGYFFALELFLFIFFCFSATLWWFFLRWQFFGCCLWNLWFYFIHGQSFSSCFRGSCWDNLSKSHTSCSDHKSWWWFPISYSIQVDFCGSSQFALSYSPILQWLRWQLKFIHDLGRSFYPKSFWLILFFKSAFRFHVLVHWIFWRSGWNLCYLVYFIFLFFCGIYR